MNICASCSALLSYASDDGFARSFPHPRLPMDAFAAAFVARRAVHRLPVSSDLFRLFYRGGGAPRGVARELAGSETPRALPAMGRAGGGSGAGAVRIVSRRTASLVNKQAAVYGQTSLDCHRSLHHRDRGWQVYVAKHPPPAPAKAARLARAPLRRNSVEPGASVLRRQQPFLCKPPLRRARRNLVPPRRRHRLTRRPRPRRRSSRRRRRLRNADLRVAPDQSWRRHRRSDPAETPGRERQAGAS